MCIISYRIGGTLGRIAWLCFSLSLFHSYVSVSSIESRIHASDIFPESNKGENSVLFLRQSRLSPNSTMSELSMVCCRSAFRCAVAMLNFAFLPGLSSLGF